MRGCSEETVLVVADIPAAPGYAWIADANTLVVSEHLDEQGRELAISRLQTDWRHTMLRPVA